MPDPESAWQEHDRLVKEIHDDFARRTPLGTYAIKLVPAAGAVCAVHKGTCHPLYYEEHHVIPQAWQAYTRPADASSGRLWDRRTAYLCRTSHGDVHFLLMLAMHAYPAAGSVSGAWTAALRQVRGHRREAAIVRLAMTRWEDRGLSLRALTDAGLWGVI